MADLERNGKFLDNVGLAKLWSLIKGMFYTKAETDGLLDDKADADSVYTKTETDTALSSKVDKETGKGLSTNDYTTAEKNKLAGIASGAEVNVQSDWNQTNTSSDDYIKNKPSVYTKSEMDTALDNKQNKVAKLGSTTKPVYTSAAGTFAECSTYAGGTKVTLNGSDKGASTASMYAPTSAGTAGQYLKSSGSGAPTWETMDTTPTASSTKAVTSGGVKTALDNKLPRKVFQIKGMSASSNTNRVLKIKYNGSHEFELHMRGWNYVSETHIIYFSAQNATDYVFSGTITHIGNAIAVSDISILFKDKTLYIVNNAASDYYTTLVFTVNEVYITESSLVNLDSVPEDAVTITPKSVITDALGDSRYMPIRFGGSTPSYLTGDYTQCYDNVMHTSVRLRRFYVHASMSNYFDNIDRKSGWTINTVNVPSSVSLFDGSMSGWNSPAASTVTEQNPTVVEITYNDSIDATDVLILRLHAHRDYTRTVSFKIEVKWTDNNWYEVGTFTEVKIPFCCTLFNSSIKTATGVSGNYIYIRGVRITFTYASSDYWLSEVELLTFRDTARANASVRALSTRGDNVYGKLNLMYDSGAIASGEKGAVTGGTVYTALQGKQNTLTFDNAPTTNSNNPVKSSGIKTALDGKVDYADTFVWTQPYNATAGSYAKVLSFPKGASLVLNITMTKYSNVSTSTVWLSASNSGQIKAWQLTDGGFAAPRTSSSPFLAFPYKNSETEGSETLKIQVVRCSCALSELTFHDTATVATGAIELQSIYKRQVERDNALSFNLPTSGTQSVNMSTYNDFVGQMTEDLETEAVIKLSNQSEGQVYNFTFTHNLNGGIAFTNSNASTVFCEIASEVPAGSTITLTSVSNTAGGWVAKVSNAGIVSSDGSVSIDWAEGVADLKVENPTIWNDSLFWKDKNSIIVGKQCVGVRKSYNNDTLRPYLYKTSSTLNTFYLNNVTSTRYSYLAVEAGETYHVTSTNYPSVYDMDVTAPVNGYLLFVKLGEQCKIDPNIYSYTIYYKSSATNTESGGNWYYCSDTASYAFIIISVSQAVIEGFQCIVLNVKYNGLYNVVAIGDNAEAAGMYSLSLGCYVKAYGYAGIALGRYSNAIGSDSVAIGDNTKALNSDSIAIGFNAVASAVDSYAIGRASKAYGNDSIALGYNTLTEAQNAIAIGYQSKARGSKCAVIGYNNEALGTESLILGISALAKNSSVVVGSNSNSFGYQCIAVGYGDNASKPNTLSSSKTDYPYLGTSKFKCKKFKHNGVDEFIHLCTDRQDVTINVDGTDYTLSTHFQNNKNFFIVVDAYATGNTGADCAVNFVDGYMEVDGVMKKQSYDETNILYVEKLGDTTYYAIWSFYSNINYMILPTDSLSVFMTYYKNTDNQRAVVLGNESKAYVKESIAVGNYLNAISDGQIVIGRYNSLDDGAKFIIGAGTGYNTRKNILTIDNKEIVHVRKVKEEGVYYCLDTSTQNIVMGDAIYVSGQDGQYIELPTSSSGVENGTTFRFVAKYACKLRQGGTIIADMAQGTFKEFLFIDGNWYVN